MRFKLSILTFALFAAYQVHAADSQNLMQIYQQALSHDPVWASAQSSHLASQEKLAQGQALFLPTVNFNAGVSATQSDAKFSPNTSPLKGGQNNFESYKLFMYCSSASS
jgi:outer membrane protein